jgi:hypothetical protein
VLINAVFDFPVCHPAITSITPSLSLAAVDPVIISLDRLHQTLGGRSRMVGPPRGKVKVGQ